MDPVIYLIILLIELFLLILIAIYSIGLLYSSIMGAPYVPTEKKRISDILKVAALKKKDVFIELGSGDGRTVLMASSQYGVRGIGIEINPLLIYLSRFLAYRQNVKNVQYIRQNILEADLTKADFVYLFLMPSLIEKIKPLFDTQLRKNTIIISHGFKLTGWEKRMFKEMKTEPFSTYYYRV